MVRTIPFTSNNAGFLGTPAYFAYPNPQPPSTRSHLPIGGNGSAMSGPPGGIATPTRGAYTNYKAGVDPQLVGYQSTALTPQGPVNYTSGGTGYIRY